MRVMLTAAMMTVALVAMGTMGKVSQAGIVTAPPYAGFTTVGSSKDNDVTGGPFSVDLSTNANFLGQVHSIVGFFGGAGSADIQHESYDGSAGFFGNIDSAYAMVGRSANSNTGGFAYKFVLTSGVTSGGTISADVYFNGDPDTQGANAYISVASSLAIGGANQNFAPTTSSDEVTAQDLFTGLPGNYNGTANLDIPDGLTEFYVLVEDRGTGGRFAILNLTVDAVAIPEPSSFVLAGVFGLLGLVGSARRRK